jgi:hypothetical protein
MTADLTTHDPMTLAAAARSVLSCPSSVHLVVDGVADVASDDLCMQDLDGTPTFSCLPGADLGRAAGRRASALLTLESGLGRPGAPERAATLTLAGTLWTEKREDCDCCGEAREIVTMRLSFALLAHHLGPGRPEQQFRVPLDQFRSPAHRLNRGYLQRSVEHANQCHQEELRRAVATTSGTRLSQVVGVSLADLRPDRVEVQWVDLVGAHTRMLTFPRPATSTKELGDLLRRELHAGLC